MIGFRMLQRWSPRFSGGSWRLGEDPGYRYPLTCQWLRESINSRRPVLDKKLGLCNIIQAEVIRLWFEDIPVLLSCDVELPANEFLFPIQDTYTIRRKES